MTHNISNNNNNNNNNVTIYHTSNETYIYVYKYIWTIRIILPIHPSIRPFIHPPQ